MEALIYSQKAVNLELNEIMIARSPPNLIDGLGVAFLVDV